MLDHDLERAGGDHDLERAGGGGGAFSGRVDGILVSVGHVDARQHQQITPPKRFDEFRFMPRLMNFFIAIAGVRPRSSIAARAVEMILTLLGTLMPIAFCTRSAVGLEQGSFGVSEGASPAPSLTQPRP